MVQVEDLKKVAEPESPYKLEKPTLLSKYRIPVQHLEFEYVEACQDGKELEKILLILRSGEEGYFPHLVEATEKRLAVVKPNSKLLRKVCPVLKSSEIEKDEWENLSKGLTEWVEDAHKKDQELEDRKARSNEDLFNAEVRKTRDMSMELAKPSPGRIKSTDYESWDKYDPDTEILKMDLEEEKVKKEALKTQKESSKKTKTVRFNNFVTEAEAVYEANCEKERGNECYKAGELSNALQHYTNSLECKPLAAVYTNRALVYNKLKKYQMAIHDCKLALKLEPRNFKAHLRMAQSYDALKQYKEALESLEMAIEIDPNNSTAQHLAAQVRKECGIVTTNRRLNIQDVDSNDVNNEKVPKPILKSSENNKDDLSKSTNSFNSVKQECIFKNTEKPKAPLEITKNINNKSNKTPLKPILKVENKTEIKSKKSSKASKGYEVISIPGSSKMPPPYYKVVQSTDPRVIKREKQKILAKPCLLHITIVDVASDDEDLTYRVESTNKKLNVSPVKTSKQVEKNCEPETLKFSKEKLKVIHKSSKNACKRKPNQKTDTQEVLQIENTKAAGGEPCNGNDEDLVPSAEELQSPYTFIETWNSVRKDASYKQHAEILRRLDSGRMHQVIGFKLDDTMLSCIMNCLYLHFMVPGELDNLHAILANITQIPRFKMMLMFLEESDWRCINQLVQFLDQHGRGLPANIRSIYTN